MIVLTQQMLEIAIYCMYCCALVVLVCYLLNIYSATVNLINLFNVNISPILHFQTFFQKLPKTTFTIFNWNWHLQ